MQYRAAKVHHVGDISAVHLLDFTVNQAVIALADTDYIQVEIASCSDNCANRRIHARRVAAACQHTDFFDFLLFLHVKTPPYFHDYICSAKI